MEDAAGFVELLHHLDEGSSGDPPGDPVIREIDQLFRFVRRVCVPIGTFVTDVIVYKLILWRFGKNSQKVDEDRFKVWTADFKEHFEVFETETKKAGTQLDFIVENQHEGISDYVGFES